MAGRASGALITAGEDGKPWLYAFARLESAFRQQRVFVVLEVPKSVALEASNRIFIRNLTLLALSAGMAMLSIWWAADVFILRRVAAMARVSRLIAAGDLRARIGKSGIRDELSHLAGVFDEMAASLQIGRIRNLVALELDNQVTLFQTGSLSRAVGGRLRRSGPPWAP